MTHFKLYIQGCGLFLLLFIVVSCIVPSLLSANDGMLPFLGVILLLMVPPAVYFYVRHVLAVLKNERIENEERQKDRALSGSSRRRGV